MTDPVPPAGPAQPEPAAFTAPQPPPAPAAPPEPSGLLDQHPEILAVGGFLGGVVLAALLKRAGRV